MGGEDEQPGRGVARADWLHRETSWRDLWNLPLTGWQCVVGWIIATLAFLRVRGVPRRHLVPGPLRVAVRDTADRARALRLPLSQRGYSPPGLGRPRFVGLGSALPTGDGGALCAVAPRAHGALPGGGGLLESLRAGARRHEPLDCPVECALAHHAAGLRLLVLLDGGRDRRTAILGQGPSWIRASGPPRRGVAPSGLHVHRLRLSPRVPDGGRPGPVRRLGRAEGAVDVVGGTRGPRGDHPAVRRPGRRHPARRGGATSSMEVAGGPGGGGRGGRRSPGAGDVR